MDSADKLSHQEQVRPRVLVIVDHPNWAHDFKTRNLQRELASEYEIRLCYQDQVTADDLAHSDLIVVYYWIQLERMEPLASDFLRHRHKLLVGICSNWELEGERREPGLSVLRRFASGVFANNLLLYREFQPALDVPFFYTPNGVDTTFFYPSPDRGPSASLRAGWAGSLLNREPGYRGLREFIQPAVNAVEGVELVTTTLEENRRDPKGMREFYQSLDLYICASVTEGTPNPCLEAAACGVPLLTTRVGNMPELVRDGVNGFFIERDIEDIIKKLSLLRDDPGLRASMAQEIYRDIKEWDWSILAGPYRTMFAQSLNGESKMFTTGR